MNLSLNHVEADEPITVTVTIKNSGKRSGAEVVQLYLTDVKSSVPRPVKELKGFVKNETEGSVYIEIEGEDSKVKAFVAWCEKGPACSRVAELKISEIPFVGFENFVIK